MMTEDQNVEIKSSKGSARKRKVDKSEEQIFGDEFNTSPEKIEEKKEKKRGKGKSTEDGKITFSDEAGHSKEDKANLKGVLTNMDTARLQKVKQVKLKKKEKLSVAQGQDRIPSAERKDDVKGDKDDNEPKTETNPAIEYLLNWKENRNVWAFKKVRQVWLLKNLYDDSKISKRHFKILLKYMKELKGNSRQETLTKAKEIMEQNEDEGMDSEVSTKTRRAEKIVKLLS